MLDAVYSRPGKKLYGHRGIAYLCASAVDPFGFAGDKPVFYQWDGDDLLLNVRVQPRANGDGFAEIMGDRIKLRITAPPVDGQANRRLVAYLAKVFRVAKADVSIVAGESGRNKRIRIHHPQRWPAMFGDAH